jgi:hypothetical protein
VDARSQWARRSGNAPLLSRGAEPSGMDKVSIGLRGWRFDEDAVLTDDGELRPPAKMEPEVRERVLRLHRLVEAPCDACWLIHGDEEINRCRVARAVYGEPFEEVVLCDEHEPDFLYWFREVGGRDLAGTEAFEDGFHEWFLDGGRAPEGYAGLEHVETAPEDVPEFDRDDAEFDADDEDGVAGDAGAATEDDLDEDLDLGMDYPSGN